MAWNRDIQSRCYRAAGFGLVAAIAIGGFAGPAAAEHWDHRDRDRDRDWHHHGDGGYYPAPPLVYNRPYYNQPYYAPPPVVYGPGFGLNIHVR